MCLQKTNSPQPCVSHLTDGAAAWAAAAAPAQLQPPRAGPWRCCLCKAPQPVVAAEQQSITATWRAGLADALELKHGSPAVQPPLKPRMGHVEGWHERLSPLGIELAKVMQSSWESQCLPTSCSHLPPCTCQDLLQGLSRPLAHVGSGIRQTCSCYSSVCKPFHSIAGMHPGIARMPAPMSWQLRRVRWLTSARLSTATGGRPAGATHPGPAHVRPGGAPQRRRCPGAPLLQCCLAHAPPATGA